MKLILALLLAAPAAHAQDLLRCAPHEEMAAALDAGWSEQVAVAALDRTGATIEVWANAGTGTFTVTVTTPEGPTCVATSGQGFTLVELPPPGEPT